MSAEQVERPGPRRLPTRVATAVGHVGGLHAPAQVDDDHEIAADRDAGLVALAPPRPGQTEHERDPRQRVRQPEPLAAARPGA